METQEKYVCEFNFDIESDDYERDAVNEIALFYGLKLFRKYKNIYKLWDVEYDGSKMYYIRIIRCYNKEEADFILHNKEKNITIYFKYYKKQLKNKKYGNNSI